MYPAIATCRVTGEVYGLDEPFKSQCDDTNVPAGCYEVGPNVVLLPW